MTEPFDEYGERLRRVLHAEAEAVTPSPEGLEQIRGKINKRRERRFAAWFTIPWPRFAAWFTIPWPRFAAWFTVPWPRFAAWFTIPWLRPLAAVAASIAIAGFAVSATPALKTFVQTGRFSPESQPGGGTSVVGGQHVVTPPPPANPSHSEPGAPPHPTSTRTSSGTHVIPGHKCPPGEDPIKSPAGAGGETTSSGPTPQVTCSPDPVSSSPATQPVSPPPAVTTPPPTPTSDAPTSGVGQPSIQSSP